jgi:hypothetical protein
VIRTALLALAVGALAACAPVASTPAPSAQTTEASCATRGGHIQPVGRMGLPTCVAPYADAGKACTDKAQCQGSCILAGNLEAKTDVIGTCQKTNVQFGCFAKVVNGKAENAICVD